MKNKSFIIVLVLCLAFIPALQVQADSEPSIQDITQGNPVTGGTFTINFLVSDNDGVDTVRIYAYFRVFDDVSTPEYPTVFETSPGVYESTVNVPVNASIMHYTIQASDNNGNWNFSDVIDRDVHDNIEPLAITIPSANVDLGEPYQFNGSSSRDNVGIAFYDWSFAYGGSTIALNGTEPVFNFTKYGTYIVTLKVTDAGGNSGTSSISVSTNDGIGPVADPGIDQFGVIGQVIVLDGSSSTDNVDIAEYVWNFYHNGTLMTLNGQNTNFSFWEVREYNVTLTVTDAAGNSDEESFTVHVLNENAVIEESDELPWWTFALMAMVIAVMIAAVFIIKSSKE